MPEEIDFLQYLKLANVTLNEYSFNTTKIANIQTQLERLIETNFYLHKSSREAYKSYLHVCKVSYIGLPIAQLERYLQCSFIGSSEGS